MPFILAIVFLCIIGVISFASSELVKINKQAAENERQYQALQEQLKQQEQRYEQLDERLKNIETIVTDIGFIDPPTTGREAINLKSEISELKQIIQQMKR